MKKITNTSKRKSKKRRKKKTKRRIRKEVVKLDIFSVEFGIGLVAIFFSYLFIVVPLSVHIRDKRKRDREQHKKERGEEKREKRNE